MLGLYACALVDEIEMWDVMVLGYVRLRGRK